MKTLNMKKSAIVFLTMISVLFLSVMPVFATSVDTTVVNTTNTTTTGPELGATDLNNTQNPAGLPTASIEDLQDKAESKMFSIVSLLQTIGKPFFIVCFIISTVFTIIGLFGRAGVWKGVIGMFLSGILYACVMYAPEIVQWIQIWAAS